MNATRELPVYQCHKKVWALKIMTVSKHAHPNPDADDAQFEASAQFQGAILLFEDERYAGIPVDADWYRKHKPTEGGYYVVYQDGYTSFSPAAAFESGYAAVQPPAQPPKVVLLSLGRGTTVTLNGIPVELEHDTLVNAAPGNVPLMFNTDNAAG